MPKRTRTGKPTVFARGQLVQDSENTITLYFGDLKPINFRRNGVGSENFALALEMIERETGEEEQD